jgi:hypothetical protein
MELSTIVVITFIFAWLFGSLYFLRVFDKKEKTYKRNNTSSPEAFEVIDKPKSFQISLVLEKDQSIDDVVFSDMVVKVSELMNGGFLLPVQKSAETNVSSENADTEKVLLTGGVTDKLDVSDLIIPHYPSYEFIEEENDEASDPIYESPRSALKDSII